MLASGVMPPMWWAFEMWKYTARDPCTGCVRTIGCSMGFPYFARSSGRVSVWSSSRLLNVVSVARRRRSASGSARYAARMLATLVPPPAEGISTPYRMVAAGGRSRFVWSVCHRSAGRWPFRCQINPIREKPGMWCCE